MRNFLKIISIILLCVTFPTINFTHAIKQGDDVSILINPKDKEQHSKKFVVNIIIDFVKKELYNENVYLSYHVYDESGKDLLWEGERYRLSKDANGKTEVEVTIDLSQESLINVNKGNIKFDLVDEKNSYWFSTNSKINFSSEEVVFDCSFWNEFRGTLSSSIVGNPFIFSLNLLCCLLSLISLIIIKRRGFLYN